MASRGGGAGGKAKAAGTFAFVAPTFDLDPDTQAWIAAVIKAGGTVTAPLKLEVNRLIIGLKTDGVWTKLDRLWLFAIDSLFEALIDIVARATATVVGSVTQTPHGVTGDGVTGHIDTNYSPSVSGVKYVRDSASVSAWCVTNRALQPFCITGASDVTNHDSDLFNYINSGGQGVFVRVNAGGGTTLTNGNSRGLFTVNRSGGSSCEAYYNGASIGTTADASLGVPTVNFWVCGNNLNNVMNGPSTDECAAVAYGGSLNATDAANLYGRLRSYMNGMGVP